jgi:hypothetical protein
MCRTCAAPIVQAKRGRPRLYCSNRCRKAQQNRATEYANRNTKRASRAAPPIPLLHSGHPLFDRARAIVGPRRTSLTTLYDPLYDDLIAVATLAILEGTDPKEAVRIYGARERAFGRVTCQLIEAA